MTTITRICPVKNRPCAALPAACPSDVCALDADEVATGGEVAPEVEEAMRGGGLALGAVIEGHAGPTTCSTCTTAPECQAVGACIGSAI